MKPASLTLAILNLMILSACVPATATPPANTASNQPPAIIVPSPVIEPSPVIKASATPAATRTPAPEASLPISAGIASEARIQDGIRCLDSKGDAAKSTVESLLKTYQQRKDSTDLGEAEAQKRYLQPALPLLVDKGC